MNSPFEGTEDIELQKAIFLSFQQDLIVNNDKKSLVRELEDFRFQQEMQIALEASTKDVYSEEDPSMRIYQGLFRTSVAIGVQEMEPSAWGYPYLSDDGDEEANMSTGGTHMMSEHSSSAHVHAPCSDDIAAVARHPVMEWTELIDEDDDTISVLNLSAGVAQLSLYHADQLQDGLVSWKRPDVLPQLLQPAAYSHSHYSETALASDDSSFPLKTEDQVVSLDVEAEAVPATAALEDDSLSSSSSSFSNFCMVYRGDAPAARLGDIDKETSSSSGSRSEDYVKIQHHDDLKPSSSAEKDDHSALSSDEGSWLKSDFSDSLTTA